MHQHLHQSPKLFSLKKANGIYRTIQPVITVNTDKVSFGISANDKVTGTSNANGIYEAILYLDEKPIVGFQIDSISYDETRYVNAHIDYKTRAAGGPFIEHLSRLPGYPGGIYKDFNGDGVIELTDDSVHEVKIVVRDTNGNASTLQFHIKKGLIRENGLKKDSASYYNQKEFHPGYVNIFESQDLEVILSPKDLYDSFVFVYSKKPGGDFSYSYSGTYVVESGLVPVHSNFTLKIKADKAVPLQVKDKLLIKRTWGSKTEIIKASADAEWYTAKFRAFGNFELIADTVPPVIYGGFRDNSNLAKSSRVVFIPRDNNNEIKTFRAELDGRWLRFTNDKGHSFIYNFDEMCDRGKHVLKITVSDEAGNTTEKTYHFTR